MTTKTITPATKGQMKSILRLFEEVGEAELAKCELDKDGAQQLLGKGGEFKEGIAKLLAPLVQRFATVPNLVTVPDLSAVDLTALAKRDFGRAAYLDDSYAEWDFYRSYEGQLIEGRGKTYEVVIWKPRRAIFSEEVRAHFREIGCFGHAGAFTEWRRQNLDLRGWHASIPEDRACWRGDRGELLVPSSSFDVEGRWFGLGWLDDVWGDYMSFVAFREVS